MLEMKLYTRANNPRILTISNYIEVFIMLNPTIDVINRKRTLSNQIQIIEFYSKSLHELESASFIRWLKNSIGNDLQKRCLMSKEIEYNVGDKCSKNCIGNLVLLQNGFSVTNNNVVSDNCYIEVLQCDLCKVYIYVYIS